MIVAPDRSTKTLVALAGEADLDRARAAFENQRDNDIANLRYGFFLKPDAERYGWGSFVVDEVTYVAMSCALTNETTSSQIALRDALLASAGVIRHRDVQLAASKTPGSSLDGVGILDALVGIVSRTYPNDGGYVSAYGAAQQLRHVATIAHAFADTIVPGSERQGANDAMQKIVDTFGTHVALGMLASAVESTPDVEQRDRRIGRLADEFDADASDEDGSVNCAEYGEVA